MQAPPATSSMNERPAATRVGRAGKAGLVSGRVILVVALLLGVGGAWGQSVDTTYVQTFPESLNLRLLYVIKGGDLRVRHPQQEGPLLYLPRYHPRVGVGGFVWNIGFSLLLPLPPAWFGQDPRIRRFDFQSSIFTSRWLVDGIFQRYQGFTLRRTGGGVPSQTSEFYPQLVTKKISLSAAYLPNGDRVSLRSPFNQGARQRKSAGSLLLSGSGTYLTVRDPVAVVPSVGLPAEQPLERVRVYTLSTKVGYTTNLVFREWFVHLLAMAGLDGQRTYYLQGETQAGFAVQPAYDLRGGMGYDTGRWYVGAYGTYDYNQYRAGSWQFRATSGQLRFFFGMRLTEPKWLRRRKPKFLEDWQKSPSIPLPPIFG
ncbi:MAG: DUF4421 family protein [Tunicatimonas sp.]